MFVHLIVPNRIRCTLNFHLQYAGLAAEALGHTGFSTAWSSCHEDRPRWPTATLLPTMLR